MIYEQSNCYCQNFRLKLIQLFFSFPTWNRLMQMLQNTRLWFLQGELGLFWSSENALVTAHIYYSSCIFLTVNLQAAIRLHASRQEKKSSLPAVTLGAGDKEPTSPYHASQPSEASPCSSARSANTRPLLPFVSKSFHAEAQSRTQA